MEISLQRLSTEHNRPGVFGFLWKFDEYEFVVPLTENLTNSEIVKLVEFIKILVFQISSDCFFDLFHLF